MTATCQHAEPTLDRDELPNAGAQRLPDPRQRAETMLAAALAVGGLAATIACGLLSPQGIHHWDDLVHFLYAKWAWRWPAYLVDGWGRPGFTLLYVLPAQLGWPACRVLSACLTAASAWMAFRLAQGLGLRHAWAVVLFCYAQPRFFQLAQTTLTETTLAFYLTAAVLLAYRGRWPLSAALLSLGLVTRHEAIIFVPIWAFFAWRQRVALWRLWPVVIAPAAVNILAVVAGAQPAVLSLFAPRPSGYYGHGGWLTFFVRAMEAWGPAITVLAIVGIPAMWKRTAAAIAVTCIVVYFATHAVLRAFGLFDTGGYARFLVPISPLVGVAALEGWQRLWAADRKQWRTAVLLAAAGMIVLWVSMRRQLALAAAGIDAIAELPDCYRHKQVVSIATIAIVLLAILCTGYSLRMGNRRWPRALIPTLLAGLMLLTSYALCGPLPRPTAAYAADELQSWLAEHGMADRPIICAHPWLVYVTGRVLPPNRPSLPEELREAPLGTLLIWDEQFSGAAYPDQFTGAPYPELKLAALQADPALRLIYRTRPVGSQRTPYLTVFEKTGPWQPKQSPAGHAAGLDETPH